MPAVEWLFPAVLLADLDLEPINLSDQFVLTYLAGDIFPAYAGSFSPGTIDLGFRVQIRVPSAQNLHFREQVELFEMFRGRSQNSETTFVYQLSILFHKSGLRFSCESVPPLTTIRTCLDHSALLPGVVLLGRSPHPRIPKKLVAAENFPHGSPHIDTRV